jgi:hypothetical protein
MPVNNAMKPAQSETMSNDVRSRKHYGKSYVESHVPDITEAPFNVKPSQRHNGRSTAETFPTEHTKPIIKTFPERREQSTNEYVSSPGKHIVKGAPSEMAAALGGAASPELASPKARGKQHVSGAVKEAVMRPVKYVQGGSTTLHGDVQ